eukprot:GHVO01058048.1.p1 GENE.GHVO01058048.1~~GHVO01058048.1.p1  ORF type:complete len:158 (-),score=30.53 GHVO01058048.1:563-985(-)
MALDCAHPDLVIMNVITALAHLCVPKMTYGPLCGLLRIMQCRVLGELQGTTNAFKDTTISAIARTVSFQSQCPLCDSNAACPFPFITFTCLEGHNTACCPLTFIPVFDQSSFACHFCSTVYVPIPSLPPNVCPICAHICP